MTSLATVIRTVWWYLGGHSFIKCLEMKCFVLAFLWNMATLGWAEPEKFRAEKWLEPAQPAASAETEDWVGRKPLCFQPLGLASGPQYTSHLGLTGFSTQGWPADWKIRSPGVCPGAEVLWWTCSTQQYTTFPRLRFQEVSPVTRDEGSGLISLLN